MLSVAPFYRGEKVASSRGRGLKLDDVTTLFGEGGRLLAGAWIETACPFRAPEISEVASSRGRGLKLFDRIFFARQR